MRSLFLLALLAATPALAQDFPVTVTDASGAELTFEAPPERVVCFTEECVHAAVILGFTPAGIALIHYFTMAQDPAILGEAAVPAEGLLHYGDGFDLEAVAAIDADLFVGWGGIGADLPPEFMAGVAPVYEEHDTYAAPDVRTLSADLLALGTIMGRAERAEAYVARLEDRLAAYQALRPEGGPSLVHVRLEDPDAGTMWIAPCATTLVGTVARCAYDGTDWAQVTSEALLAMDPDVIVVEDLYEDAYTFTPEEWSGVPLWNEVVAVREERVHFVPSWATGPFSPLSLDRALDALMPLLYPDTFPAPLTDAEVQDILVGGE